MESQPGQFLAVQPTNVYATMRGRRNEDIVKVIETGDPIDIQEIITDKTTKLQYGQLRDGTWITMKNMNDGTVWVERDTVTTIIRNHANYPHPPLESTSAFRIWVLKKKNFAKTLFFRIWTKITLLIQRYPE